MYMLMFNEDYPLQLLKAEKQEMEQEKEAWEFMKL